MLGERAKDREKRNELSLIKKSSPEQVKILIGNILLAINMNAFNELAQLCLSFQRRNLTVMEGHCFARANIEKLRSQYLTEEKDVKWSDRVKEAMRASSAEDRNIGEITCFIGKLCDHLDARFPEDELKEWIGK